MFPSLLLCFYHFAETELVVFEYLQSIMLLHSLFIETILKIVEFNVLKGGISKYKCSSYTLVLQSLGFLRLAFIKVSLNKPMAINYPQKVGILLIPRCVSTV